MNFIHFENTSRTEHFFPYRVEKKDIINSIHHTTWSTNCIRYVKLSIYILFIDSQSVPSRLDFKSY